MNVMYVSSESTTVQGSLEDVRKEYGKNWYINELGGGHGNWLLTKPSDVLVNGKSYRDFVLKHYQRKKLTERLVDKFREDLENGKVELPL